jgi:hypothetical protein
MVLVIDAILRNANADLAQAAVQAAFVAPASQTPEAASVPPVTEASPDHIMVGDRHPNPKGPQWRSEAVAVDVLPRNRDDCGELKAAASPEPSVSSLPPSKEMLEATLSELDALLAAPDRDPVWYARLEKMQSQLESFG